MAKPMVSTFSKAALVVLFCFSSSIHGDDVNQLLKKGEQALVEKSFDNAAKHFLAAAELGDGAAQVKLALMILQGQAADLDYARALHWLTLAANNGSISGMYNLGNMYKEGQGTKIDYLEAALWYKKAAELGDKQAQYELAQMYKNGLGVSRYYDKSVYWLYKAAKQNHAGAQANLGLALIIGEGTKRNYVEAAQWLNKAAEQGHKAAKNNLGYLYEHGHGVEQSFETAIKLYKEVDTDWSRTRQSILAKKMRCLNEASTILFKTEIKCTDRATLSKAIKAGGAVPIEEDHSSWGDSYLTRSHLFGSSELYVAYTLDNRFAIAQYTFADSMDLEKLGKMREFVTSAYGEPNAKSDKNRQGTVRYQWMLEDGILLSLTRDNQDKIVELTYTFEKNFNAMLKEQANQDKVTGEQLSFDETKRQF